MSPSGKGRDIKECKACKGKGYTLTIVNAGSLWKRECPVCNGSGRKE